MNKIILGGVLTFMISMPAQAHPGHGYEPTLKGTIHELVEPSHLGAALFFLIGAIAVGMVFKSRKAQKKHVPGSRNR